MRIGELNLYFFKMSNPIPHIAIKEDIVLHFLKKRSPELSLVVSNVVSDQRFSRGSVCSCLFHQNKIVSYCWLSFQEEWIGEIETTISLKMDEVYLFDAFTLPEYRGKNLFPFLLTNTITYLKTQGYCYALIFALSTNRVSIKAIQKAGFKYFRKVRDGTSSLLPYLPYS